MTFLSPHLFINLSLFSKANAAFVEENYSGAAEVRKTILSDLKRLLQVTLINSYLFAVSFHWQLCSCTPRRLRCQVVRHQLSCTSIVHTSCRSWADTKTPNQIRWQPSISIPMTLKPTWGRALLASTWSSTLKPLTLSRLVAILQEVNNRLFYS